MPTLKRPDVELYYELAGFGPPVLLIQGVGVVGGCWRPQVTSLQGEFQTAIFDNRGIGGSVPCQGPIRIESMADDALAVMEAAGWDSAHVVGHSMGGVIAQQVALNCPHRVRSLSLLCTFPRGKDAARLTPWVLWMTLRTRIGTRRMRRQAFLEMLWPAAALRQADGAVLAREVKELIGRDLANSPRILMQQVAALSRHDISRRLNELRSIPTWVLSAEHDPIALPRYGRALAQAIPGAQFDLMPDVSHGVTLHQPKAVSQKLAEFIGGVEGRKGKDPHPFPLPSDGRG